MRTATSKPSCTRSTNWSLHTRSAVTSGLRLEEPLQHCSEVRLGEGDRRGDAQAPARSSAFAPRAPAAPPAAPRE